MVRNLERSRRFYAEVIGLTATYFDADLSATVSSRMLGTQAGSSIRVAILKPAAIAGRPAPDFGMVGLFELGDTDIPAVPARKDGVAFGEGVLVFYVANLAAALDSVKALGGYIVTEPARFEYNDISVAEVIIRDPDGIAINLVETQEHLAWGTNQTQA
jgi:catechol 2,3-dioxygenase-like lactoylglutathione lyase family enzyme